MDISIGDIGKSKFYFAVFTHHYNWRFSVTFNKTYHGTKCGVTMFVGKLFIMAHIR